MGMSPVDDGTQPLRILALRPEESPRESAVTMAGPYLSTIDRLDTRLIVCRHSVAGDSRDD
jgi:hypothetical protein